MSAACAPLLVCIVLVAVMLLLICGRGSSANPFAAAPTNTSYYLRGDGTWAVTNMTGAVAANGSVPGVVGTPGFVPPPQIADTSNFLRGDGTWAGIPNTHQYLHIAGATTFSPPVGTAAGAAVAVAFAGTPTIRGTMVTGNAALTQFSVSPLNGVETTYKVSFGYSMISGSSTTTYTPPTYTISNVTVAATPVAVSAVIPTIPLPVSYGKYYMVGNVTHAYVTTSATASTVISVMLTAIPTDIMVNPWLAIDQV